MYNRYIPQPDGSYRRSRIQDPVRSAPQQRPNPEPAVPCPEPQPEPIKRDLPKPVSPTPPRRSCQHHRHHPVPPQKESPNPETSVGSFLRNLIPKDFDTGDLLIVLLLLLMAGDCSEDQNSALLTLALYFFM